MNRRHRLARSGRRVVPRRVAFLRGCAVLLGVAALAAAQGCGRGDAGTTEREPIRVGTVRPRPVDAAPGIAYSGTIEASETWPLSFATAGTVARVLVAEGEPVRKGQLLALLDTTGAHDALEVALATLAQAEDAHQRLLPMARNATLPEIRMREAEADLARARASAALARKSLRDCQLRSPVDGVVGDRAVDAGMVAVPNLTSVTVVRLGRVFARVAVPEREIAGLRKGLRATLRIGALDDSPYEGTVEEIGVVADPVAHTYPARIVVRNDGRIRPGMICELRIAGGDGVNEGDGVVGPLLLPAEAVLVDEDGRRFVYLDAGGHALRRTVTLAGYGDDGILVRGLAPEDRVVARGQHKLVDGAALHAAAERW